MSGPTEPPPSYDEAQQMMSGPTQYPQQYPPQQGPYQGGKPFDGYSSNPPYPTQAGQPSPYPTQPGVAQQPYPYGQPGVPTQGAYPPAQGAYPPAQGAYPQGAYVHPTVGYNPAVGVVLQNQPNQATMPPGQFGTTAPDIQRRRKVIIGTVVTIGIIFFFIIFINVIM